jgi:hypothetical protein
VRGTDYEPHHLEGQGDGGRVRALAGVVPVLLLEGAAVAGVPARGAAELVEDLGFGRIVVSEIEVPNMQVNLV